MRRQDKQDNMMEGIECKLNAYVYTYKSILINKYTYTKNKCEYYLKYENKQVSY